MVAKLSVNINKIALLRNSREGNYPNLYQYASDCEEYGADGITVHPRPDERHIRYADVPILKDQTKTEFNIEGFPSERFLEMVLKVKPTQCTLVPDDPNQLTSDHGWDVKKHGDFLKDVCSSLQKEGIRTSLFLDPDSSLVPEVEKTGTDRIELYTGVFAELYKAKNNRWQEELDNHRLCAERASHAGIDVNAGHDLNLQNLTVYVKAITNLKEVSIGHALTVDSLYYGLKNTISMYKRCLTNP